MKNILIIMGLLVIAYGCSTSAHLNDKPKIQTISATVKNSFDARMFKKSSRYEH